MAFLVWDVLFCTHAVDLRYRYLYKHYFFWDNLNTATFDYHVCDIISETDMFGYEYKGNLVKK